MNRVARFAVVLCVSSTVTLLPAPVFPQSLLDNFYSASSGSYQGNLTPPGVYQGENLKVVTGGGFVYKVPRNQFRPLGITPPTLRAGCGGIDIFLGGMSLPSRAEFVAFLRNIGQNLPGLAFQLALQSLSPDLEAKVAEFKQMLMKISQENIDSCEAARWLLDKSGATEAIDGAGRRVSNYLVSSGTASDMSDARQQTRTDGGVIRANCSALDVTDGDGQVHEACELNLTWAILSTGRWANANSVELRQLMMTIVGPYVLRWQGSGPDSVLVPYPFEAKIITPKDLLGTVNAATVQQLKWYTCPDTVRCLEPQEADYNDVSLARRVSVAAKAYADSIRLRDPSLATPTDRFILASASSIPMLRIINSVGLRRYKDFGDNIMDIFSEAVAYELVLRFMDDMAINAKKAIYDKQTNGNSSRIREHAQVLLARIESTKQEIRQGSEEIQMRVARASSLIQVVEHFDRALASNLATDLASNIKFASTVRP
jgi:conjugative transfer pilus assembly protein TraH